MRRPEQLSAAQARRINLYAQGFGEKRPTGRVDIRHVRKVFDRLGLVQIDSVNVLVRSHYLPLFSRLGPYDRSLLDRYVHQDHEAFEYWGHEASIIQARFHPLLRWRMASEHRWAGMRRFAKEKADLIEEVLALVLEQGLVGAGDLGTRDVRKEPWWDWNDHKAALEHLFYEGRLAATRRDNFERAYGDPALLVPAEFLGAPTPTEREAMAGLLEHSARAHGVGTAKDLGDYFRLPIKAVRPLLEELADEGVVDRVEVEGWGREPAYLHPEAHLPRWVRARALVSPFDSVMWERDRVERTYGFTYRIEIYTPKPKRVFGYYVLPFLLGDRYVARVDLKADRAERRLLVQSAFAEDGVDHLEVAEALLDELRLMARWLDLDDVVVKDRGDLAPTLAMVAA
ncbi:MAG TPA: crosslink repair DNA glycosylase YcaQ family protein [Acidimicrobiales bacterium]|nr:crosslink repair DNA glycosylase YcaQ family protein [Acidimicrobiales bacterium]